MFHSVLTLLITGLEDGVGGSEGMWGGRRRGGSVAFCNSLSRNRHHLFFRCWHQTETHEPLKLFGEGGILTRSTSPTHQVLERGAEGGGGEHWALTGGHMCNMHRSEETCPRAGSTWGGGFGL